MTVTVGINGFGRIGRCTLAHIAESNRNDVQVVAINATGPVETNAHLLRYDSVHGRFPGVVKVTEDGLDLGRGLVLGMPKLMAFLSTVGTAAMLWVGGNIVIHGLEVTHLWAWPYETIHHIAEAAAHGVPAAKGFVEWLVTAALDGVFGLILGVILIPVATRVVGPLWAAAMGKKATAH